eukprot:COSAG04_NODE_6865_length_1238_cov_9.361257_2_plen_152_part_01
MLVRLAVSGLLVELARGQAAPKVYCGVTTPDRAAFATTNGHPVTCNDVSTGANLVSTLGSAMTAACEGHIPAMYLSRTGEHPYSDGTTLEDCQRDLCEATAECTQAIETWGNTLEQCNPMDNYAGSAGCAGPGDRALAGAIMEKLVAKPDFD